MRYFYKPPVEEQHFVSLTDEEATKFENEISEWDARTRSNDNNTGFKSYEEVEDFLGDTHHVYHFYSEAWADQFMRDFKWFGVEK